MPAFHRSAPAPSLWWWWCPESETKTQSQSSWLPSPGHLHQETPPGTLALLSTEQRNSQSKRFSLHNTTAKPGILTFFVLNHDGVAKRKQFEELHDIVVFLGTDTGHQGVIHECEFSVSKPIPAPVHWLRAKQEKVYWGISTFIVLLIFLLEEEEKGQTDRCTLFSGPKVQRLLVKKKKEKKEAV